MARFHGLTGEQALTQLASHLSETSRRLRANQGRLDLPGDFRRQTRRDLVADAQLAVREAEQAFAAWRDRKVADARHALAAETVGTQAEETAKLRREQKIARLIETARLRDERTGPQVVGGALVRDPAARALAAEAERLYLDTTNHDDALAYATAAEALGVDGAGRVRELAQRQIDVRDPEKRAAIRDLELAERAEVVFARDAGAALVEALHAAADEAADLGDDPSVYRRLAVGPSMAAKAASLAVARLDGKGYEPPASVTTAEAALAAGPSLRGAQE